MTKIAQSASLLSSYFTPRSNNDSTASKASKRTGHLGPLPAQPVKKTGSAHDDDPSGIDELLKAKASARQARPPIKGGRNPIPLPVIPNPNASAHDSGGDAHDTSFGVQSGTSVDSKISANKSAELTKLKEASGQVEGLFVKQLIQKMQQSVPNADSAGPYADLANDMMAQAISDSVGKSGGLGISKVLYDNLSKALVAQESARQATDTTSINLAS